MTRVALAVLVMMAAAPGARARPLTRAAPEPDKPNPCAALGPGFVRVPGGSTCVKIKGSVAVETGIVRSVR